MEKTNYQAPIENYAVTSDSPANKNVKQEKTILVLTAEILGLLAVFTVFLLVLNYFKIVSLSSLLPKTATPTVAPVNTNATSNQSAGASFVKLQNQTTDAQVRAYQTYATRFSGPTAQTTPNDYVSDAVFSGYDSQTIQVVTKEGVLNLRFDQNTLFQKFSNPNAQVNNATASGSLPKPVRYAQADFFRNVPFGSTLQVYFSKPELKTTQVNYIESIKPLP